MANTFAWIAFIAALPVLWLTGLRLFLQTDLTRLKRVLWPIALAAVGVCAGYLLSLTAIRDRFLAILLAVPILSLVDIKLARSNRTFLFWFRACAFEVSTVFGAAAATRLALGPD